MPSVGAVRALTKTVSDQMNCGRPRESAPVRRDTFDVEDPEARVERPLGDTVEDVHDVRTAILRAVDRFRCEVIEQGHYSQGGVTRVGFDVLKVLLTDPEGFDHFTCTNDSAESQIAQKARASASQVRVVKKHLYAAGLIDWVRRSVATGLPKAAGVIQRVTTSCLYFFTPERLTGRLAELYGEELRLLRAARQRIERATGKEGLRRALERRRSRRQHIPALLNPRGWAAALKSLTTAETKATQAAAAEEARAIAYATQLAQQYHVTPV